MNIIFYEISPLAKLFPPISAKKLVPDWYKDHELEISDVQQLASGSNLSVKRCIPVLDYITSGYIIRNYTDIVVRRNWSSTHGEDFNIDFKMTNIPPISFHSTDQMQIKRNGHFKKIAKFNGVWGIETPAGYSSLFYQPEYFNERRFKIFPGIVDTDQYVDPIGFPFMFEDSTEKEEYIIEAGTPLVCVFPFKRQEWTSEIRPYEKNNKAAILMKTIWNGAYRKFMHSKKSYN